MDNSDNDSNNDNIQKKQKLNDGMERKIGSF
jgi:hypothetical protein